ncbi:MAG: septum formation protein Maf [Myxococcales bacterium]|nr:septum formation protein Maf [Myxococcales bacterium]
MHSVPRHSLPELPLLLASASPRRRELLERVGLPLVVLAVDVDETPLPAEPAAAYVERVTLAKLAAAGQAASARGIGHAACLVADTTVVVDGAILGKPADASEGAAMIRAIAGRAHEVSTRFAIALAGQAGVAHAQTVTTRVHVRALDEDFIARYVATGEGRDKAGGYAIQGLFSSAIPRIEGSYTNVVGLPVSEVVEALEALAVLARFPLVEAAR